MKKKEKDEAFGQRLRMLRKEERLTQTEFAVKIGLTPEHQANVAFWESGTKPQTDTMETIFSAFPLLNRKWLLGNEGTMFISKNEKAVSNESSLINELMIEKSRLLSIIEKLISISESNFPEDSRQAPFRKVWSTIRAVS